MDCVFSASSASPVLERYRWADYVTFKSAYFLIYRMHFMQYTHSLRSLYGCWPFLNMRLKQTQSRHCAATASVCGSATKRLLQCAGQVEEGVVVLVVLVHLSRCWRPAHQAAAVEEQVENLRGS